MPTSRRAVAVAACLLAPLAGVACGEDAAPSRSPNPASSTPADVASGLNRLAALADDIADSSPSAGKAESAKLAPIWTKVGGTVEREEPDDHATVEEDLALLRSGDPAKTKRAADDLRATVRGYLERHPDSGG